MIRAFRVIRRAGRLFFEELYLLFILNIFTAVAFFLIVPFPPALFALWVAARRACQGRILRVGDWWAALKRYFWPAWGLALVNLLVGSLAIYNIRFYGSAGNFPLSDPAWLPAALQGAVVALLVFWSMGQLYAAPLMLEQDRPRPLPAIWHSFALLVANPGYGLALFLVVLVLLVLGTVALGLGFFVAPAAIAVLTVVATRELLAKDDPAP